MSQHKEESEVLAIQNASTKEKPALITKLRNMGDHLHNTSVLRSGSGILVVGYRPNQNDVDPNDYVPCPNCFIYLVHSDLWRHKCPLMDAAADQQKPTKPGVRAGRLLLPSKNDLNHPVDDIVKTMRMDVVGRVVRSDPLIIALGRKLCPTHAHDDDRHNALREHMRRMGRLLIQLRLQDKDPDARLKKYMDPQQFRQVFEATKVISGFNSRTNTMLLPSLALKVGHDLRKCAMILKCQALETADGLQVKRTEEFLAVLDATWPEITAPAHRVISETQQNKAKLLPLTEDIMKLSTKLKETGHACLTKLHQARASSFTSEHKKAWINLNEVALAYLILFNRRRSGEVSKMKVKNFSERQAPGNQGDIHKCLSEVERALCESFTRIEISGKRGKTVPILLTSEVENWISTLLEFRVAAGVTDTNSYLFARSSLSTEGHIRGCDVMRVWSQDAGARQPELLRSTRLRKHVATVSQIVNLKNNELDILANFLGHDIRVHREFYRLPQETLQVAKVSKLLLACESGQNISGKTIDEIQVSVDEGEQIVKIKCLEPTFILFVLFSEVVRSSGSEEEDGSDVDGDGVHLSCASVVGKYQEFRFSRQTALSLSIELLCWLLSSYYLINTHAFSVPRQSVSVEDEPSETRGIKRSGEGGGTAKKKLKGKLMIL